MRGPKHLAPALAPISPPCCSTPGFAAVSQKPCTPSHLLQVTTDMLRHLVQATVRVQQGRDSSAVLPQEVTSTFIAAYQRLLQPCDRAQLLEMLASDFGTNSELQALAQAAECCARPCRCPENKTCPAGPLHPQHVTQQALLHMLRRW